MVNEELKEKTKKTHDLVVARERYYATLREICELNLQLCHREHELIEIYYKLEADEE